MKLFRISPNLRLSSDSFDAQVAAMVCPIAAFALIPVSVIALVRHPGSRPEFLLGCGLAVLLGLLLLMLGTTCRRMPEWRVKVATRSRWPEFASYPVCMGIMILGLRALPRLGLTPSQVTLGVLLISSLSLAVLVLGMLTTQTQARSDPD